jgi:hypothetical protein
MANETHYYEVCLSQRIFWRIQVDFTKKEHAEYLIDDLENCTEEYLREVAEEIAIDNCGLDAAVDGGKITVDELILQTLEGVDEDGQELE